MKFPLFLQALLWSVCLVVNVYFAAFERAIGHAVAAGLALALLLDVAVKSLKP